MKVKMMFLQTKDGILCDLCGEESKNKFVYYSHTCTRVVVDMDIKRTGPATIENDIVDFDVCEKCHEQMVNKTLEARRKYE